jgi:hypothetical protein
MPDFVAGQPGDEGASAPAPALTQADIDKLKAELEGQFDERAKGFQRLIAEREQAIEALRNEIEESRLAGMSEDEREALLITKKDRRIEELEAKLELQRLASSYGSEMPYFERLIGAESTEQQLQVMREFAQTLAPAAPPPPTESEVEVPDVDLNRPMRRWDPTVTLPDGRVMNDALADQILGSIGRQADVTQRNLRNQG